MINAEERQQTAEEGRVWMVIMAAFGVVALVASVVILFIYVNLAVRIMFAVDEAIDLKYSTLAVLIEIPLGLILTSIFLYGLLWTLSAVGEGFIAKISDPEEIVQVVKSEEVGEK